MTSAARRRGLVDGVRLSPHIYNTLADADRVVDALKAIAA